MLITTELIENAKDPKVKIVLTACLHGLTLRRIVKQTIQKAMVAMRKCDNSIPALRRKLVTAEKKVLKLKSERPLPPDKRNSDRHCMSYMQNLYMQMKKVESIKNQIVEAEQQKYQRKRGGR